MNILGENLVFLTEKLIPTSKTCIDCSCKCEGSIYSLDSDDRDLCMYLPDPKFSMLSHIILKDSYVNYNHFIFARVCGIDLNESEICNFINDIRNKMTVNNKIENLNYYKQIISDYEIAINIPLAKIIELKNIYNVEKEDLYIETIQYYNKNFNFSDF